jgi:hypothetical protein
MKIAPLRWPACNAGYDGPLPRPMILDTNVVLDMLIFDDPDIPAIRELVARGEVRWIADEAQRIELGRVLHYSQIAPRVSYYGKTPEGVMAALMQPSNMCPLPPRSALPAPIPTTSISSIWPASTRPCWSARTGPCSSSASAWQRTMARRWAMWW